MEEPKEKGGEPEVADIEVKQADVHNLVSSWMNDTLGLSDEGESDDDKASRAVSAEEDEAAEQEVRMPRVGLGAEAKAERGAWKKSEAAAEKLAPGARGVADRLKRQAAQAGAPQARRADRRQDDDDDEGKVGSIVKLAGRKQPAKTKDAVTLLLEKKQKKRERKAEKKASKENQEDNTEVAESVAPAQEDEVERPKKKHRAAPDAVVPSKTEKHKGAKEEEEEEQEKKEDEGANKDEPEAKDEEKEEEDKKPKHHENKKSGRTAKIKYQQGPDGKMRKRTKTRSKKKNLRRDHRPLEQRPQSGGTAEQAK